MLRKKSIFEDKKELEEIKEMSFFIRKLLDQKVPKYKIHELFRKEFGQHIPDWLDYIHRNEWYSTPKQQDKKKSKKKKHIFKEENGLPVSKRRFLDLCRLIFKKFNSPQEAFKYAIGKKKDPKKYFDAYLYGEKWYNEKYQQYLNMKKNNKIKSKKKGNK